MGIFSKIANIFYDEVEETEEPKKEVKREERKPVEIRDEKPKIEEYHFERSKEEVVKPKNEDTIEREVFKREVKEAKTFKFPIIDEEEEEEEVKVAPEITRTRSSIYDIEKPEAPKEVRRESKYDSIVTRAQETRQEPSVTKKPEMRIFRPTPVISPVYGILDKNYTKEEIIARQDVVRRSDDDMNYDSVRRKAYGTLEDELENTLNKISIAKKDVEKTIEEMDNYSEEENNKSIEDLLNEIESNKNMSIGEIEEKIKDQMEEEEESSHEEEKVVEDEPEILSPKKEKETKVKEEEEEDFDKTLEHDLFNLIDSMYEEKERE